MALHPKMACSPSAWRLLRHIAVMAIVLFGLSVPARADVIVVENEQQLKRILEILNASRSEYLKASRAIAPCYQNRHLDCQTSMRVAIIELAQGAKVAGTTLKDFLYAIRNNSFSYERAYTLLFLNAVIEGNPRGGCSEWIRLAEEPMAQNQVRTLNQHLQKAAEEVGKRESLPEFKMLTRVRAVLNPCIGVV